MKRVTQSPRGSCFNTTWGDFSNGAAEFGGGYSCIGGSEFFGELNLPDFSRNRKGTRGSAKPLAVPNLDNRPRYETPDPCQLPTPKDTPRVELPVIAARRDRLLEERESEARQLGVDSDDDTGIGPWVGKGNPVGFLDSEDEELIDELGREQKKERFNSMNREEWKTVALFLLGHMVSLVGGRGKPEGIDFVYVQAILGEDGSDLELVDLLYSVV